jgi:5-methylcytosine-specific restriction enzyme subunit McrC
VTAARAAPRTISLVEYERRSVARVDLGEVDARRLWETHHSRVDVESPPFGSSADWILTSKGWVGWIPVSGELTLELKPRVRLASLFAMLEYAFRLKGFLVLPGIVDSDSVRELYERLASILAGRVLDRSRRGLYRSYVLERDALPYLRGRFDVEEALARPHRVRLPCIFEENTADLEDNQILAWVIHLILMSGICTERTLPRVRMAYLTLRGSVTVRPFGPLDCIGRRYNRLNADYLPLHALCHFLESSGPMHEPGGKLMLPFLVDMARLFELSVAEWLQQHLPRTMSLSPQDIVRIGSTGSIEFRIDLTLHDANSGACLAVMDTKYKITDTPTSGDVAQIVACAVARGARTGVLIYPRRLSRPFRAEVGGISVHAVSFPIDGNLEAGGQGFVEEIAAVLSRAHVTA